MVNFIKMDTFITLDKNGRVTIPTKIRKKYKTKKFILKAKKNEVVLKPIMSIDQLFGALPDLDIEKLKEEHEREVEHENNKDNG